MNEKGRVIKSTGNFYTIVTSGMEKIECQLAGRYRLEDLKSTNPVVVGIRAPCRQRTRQNP